MGYRKFRQNSVFRRKAFLYNTAKILDLNKNQIERLLPKRMSCGAEFLLIIECNASQHNAQSKQLNLVLRKVL